MLFTLNGLTIAAGARPTLSGTVTLANNTVVSGVNFSAAAPALAASAVTGPVGIDQVGVTGGTTALSLTNVSGAVTVTNATFTKRHERQPQSLGLEPPLARREAVPRRPLWPRHVFCLPHVHDDTMPAGQALMIPTPRDASSLPPPDAGWR